MAYVANQHLKFDSCTVEAGEIIPDSVHWKGGSLRAAINVGMVTLVPNQNAPGKASAQARVEAPADPGLNLICTNCDRTFKSQRGLSLHAKTHAAG